MPPVKKKIKKNMKNRLQKKTENGIKKSNYNFLYGCAVNGIFIFIIM